MKEWQQYALAGAIGGGFMGLMKSGPIGFLAIAPIGAVGALIGLALSRVAHKPIRLPWQRRNSAGTESQRR